MGHLGRATFTKHSIGTHTTKEGIKCTKVKEYLWSYCPNTYTVSIGNPQIINDGIQRDPIVRRTTSTTLESVFN